MSKNEVIELFELIVEVYPRFNVSVNRVNAWHEMLSDLPYEIARKNLINHCKSSKFEPTVSDVRGGRIEREYKSNSVDAGELLEGMEWEV